MTTKKINIAIYGTGGHAFVLLDTILKCKEQYENNFNFVGFYDYAKPKGTTIKGYTILGSDKELLEDKNRVYDMLYVGIGDNNVRKEIFTKVDIEEKLPNMLVHPTAVVSNTSKVHSSSFVGPQCIVGPNVEIGKGVIINSGAVISHDNVINDFVHISPNATICGNSTIGEGTWVGAGAVVIQGIAVGKESIVGANSTVLKDVPSYTTVVGVVKKDKK